MGEQLDGGVGVLGEGGEVLGVGHEADDGIGVEVCDLVGVVCDLEGVELEDLVDDLDELVLVEEVELVPVCVDQGVDVVEGAVEAVGEGAEAGAAFMSETVEDGLVDDMPEVVGVDATGRLDSGEDMVLVLGNDFIGVAGLDDVLEELHVDDGAPAAGEVDRVEAGGVGTVVASESCSVDDSRDEVG